LDEEMRRLSCPYCRAGFSMLVEHRKEGFFTCLTCGGEFVLPPLFGETQSSNVLKKVMP